MPLKTKLKLERISDYMRKFFDQIDIENFFTKKLKSDSKLAFILAILALFTFFILRRISLLIASNFHPVILYAFYTASAVLMLYLLSLVYKRLKVLRHTLSVILTNVDSSKNLKKCTMILDSLLIALVLFFSAMLFPFAMFALNLNTWANIVPVVFIIAAFYFVRKLVMIIDGSPHSFASRSASVAVAKF